MRLLLDTHVWLWWLLGSERLSASERRALDQLAASGNVCLAAMSLWEAQMLQAKGHLILNRPFPAWLRQAAATDVVQLLPLNADVVVIAVDALPNTFHGDPADRLIVATAVAHGLPLATHDQAIQASGLVPIWEAGHGRDHRHPCWP